MARDKVFEGTAARGSDFAFTKEVADVFDDMLVRSVPFYLEQQSITAGSDRASLGDAGRTAPVCCVCS